MIPPTETDVDKNEYPPGWCSCTYAMFVEKPTAEKPKGFLRKAFRLLVLSVVCFTVGYISRGVGL